MPAAATPDVPFVPDGLASLKACANSARIQLVVLTAVFIALPILFYGIMRTAEADRGAAQTQISSERAVLIAKGLAPVLEHGAPARPEELSQELARFQGKDLILKLFFKPLPSAGASDMTFIARAPSLEPDALKAENGASQNVQAERRLTELCEGGDSRGLSHIASDASVTTLTRIRSTHGCWGLAVTSAMPASSPFWSNPALRMTAAVYAALTLLAFSSAARLLFRLRRTRIAEAETAAAQYDDSPAMELEPTPLEDAPPGLLDITRGEINLSEVVRTYLDAERERLKDGAGRIGSQIEEGIVIHGRADFLGTILSELVGAPLGTGAAVHVDLALAHDESRRRALLTVKQDAAASDPSEIGQLPHIKQFVAALGAVSAAERCKDGGHIIRVAFQA